MIWNFLTKTLNQVGFPFFSIKSSEYDTVYLTFDDGPNKNTHLLFDFLNRHNISATHFWLFSNTDNFENKIKIGIQKIAIHGWNHTKYSSLTNQEIKTEFDKIEMEIKKLNFPIANYFRPPYGSYKSGLKSLCKKYNFKLLFWSHLFEDYAPDFEPETIKSESSAIRAGSIVVLHDKEKYYNRICETVLLLQSELSKRNLQLKCLPS